MNTMKYKDYTAKIEYSDEDGCFVGRLMGIRDIVSFHGDNVTKLRKAFKDAVDDYIQFCQEEGLTPQKPYSGRLMLRMSPTLHAKLAQEAEIKGQSLNNMLVDKLAQEMGISN